MIRGAPFALMLLVGAPALTQPVVAQDDWAAAVAKAHDHRRYAVRRAAANKLARAGDAAVPALLEFESTHGRDQVGLVVVDAIARADTRGRELERLLTSWATDPEFYWRSQALSGLARRPVADRRELFESALGDPSHLYRIEGARGLLALDADRAGVRALLRDPDPRVRSRIGELLFRHGDPAGLAALQTALTLRDHEFLGDPWGAREAMRAEKALGDAAPETTIAAVPGYRPTEGIEIRSCRHGDLFVGVFDDRICFGIDGQASIETPRAADLRASLAAALPDRQVLGRVICDFMRARTTTVEKHVKAAPEATPPAVTEWLNDLAAVVEETGSDALALQIRARLPQFTSQK